MGIFSEGSGLLGKSGKAGLLVGQGYLDVVGGKGSRNRSNSGHQTSGTGGAVGRRQLSLLLMGLVFWQRWTTWSQILLNLIAQAKRLKGQRAFYPTYVGRYRRVISYKW